MPHRRNELTGKMLWVLVAATVLVFAEPAGAQQKPNLRPLRIALPSNTIAATHFYVGKSLGIFESYGFEAQILVLFRQRDGRRA